MVCLSYCGRKLTKYEKAVFLDLWKFLTRHPDNIWYMKAINSLKEAEILAKNIRIIQGNNISNYILGITLGNTICFNSNNEIIYNKNQLSLLVHEFVHVFQLRYYSNYVKIFSDILWNGFPNVYYTPGTLENHAVIYSEEWMSKFKCFYEYNDIIEIHNSTDTGNAKDQ